MLSEIKQLFIILVFLLHWSCLTSGCADTTDSATCEFYKKRGYCTKVDWLAKKCLKTCNLCDCTDSVTSSSCTLYKKKGYCETVNWLAKKCSKTCGLCGTTTKTTTSAPSTIIAVKPSVPNVKTTQMVTTTIQSTPDFTSTASSTTPSQTKPSTTKAYVTGTTKPGEDCGKSTARSRVIGGSTSRHGQWPWQASLIYRRIGNCGATLITPEWLVTAAHCTIGKNVSFFNVTLGKLHRYRTSKYEQMRSVKLIIEHEDYKKPVRVDNDIALLKLDSPVILNKYVNTVCLPEQHNAPQTGTKCFISGWGKTLHPGYTAQELHHASLLVLNQTECIKRNKHLAPVTNKMICGSNQLPSRQSGCHGDSGGPFVCQQNNGRWFLQGAVSWGSPVCKINDGATVFTRISYYRNWINKQILKYKH